MSEADFLYRLLPVIYRQRDLAAGTPLRALLAVLQEQLDAIEGDINALYDNWFVETCEPWVLPYMAELVGLTRVSRGTRSGVDRRAFVANSVGYRRRSGIAATIERAIEDATGWPLRAVPFVELMAATHTVRLPGRGRGTISVKDARALAYLGGAFDAAAHGADVRGAGRYDARRIGVFIWQGESFPLRRIAAADLGEGRHTFHPLGWDMPLVNRRLGGGRLGTRAGIRQFPLRLRRNMLAAERSPPPPGEGAGDRFLDQEPAFAIYLSGTSDPVPPRQLAIADLSAWRWPTAAAADAAIAVDPELGRLLIRDLHRGAKILTDHCCGGAGAIGGGPYFKPLVRASERTWWRARVRAAGPEPDDDGAPVVGAPPEWPPEGAGGIRLPITDEAGVLHFSSLAEAIAQFGQQASDGVIEIADSATYAPRNKRDGWSIDLDGETRRLIIRAAAHQRPTLAGSLDITARAAEASIELGGLLIGGAIATSGRLTLSLHHCTVMPPPARNALSARPHDSRGLSLLIESSVVGPLRLPSDAAQLTIRDSIIDGRHRRAIAAPDSGPAQDRHREQPHAGPPCTMLRATVFGAVEVALLEASDTIFAASVRVTHDHAGFVRHCYVPDGSQTPQRFACCEGPAVTAVSPGGKGPVFRSLRLADPGYAQLAPGNPTAITQGASDGNEIGAFHGLADRWRRDDLGALLDDQIPFGSDPMIIDAT
jgi:hypothetical protein